MVAVSGGACKGGAAPIPLPWSGAAQSAVVASLQHGAMPPLSARHREGDGAGEHACLG
jgi:hypothetical protein